MLRLRITKIAIARRFADNRFGSVPDERRGGGQLDGRQQRDVVRPRTGGLV